MKKTTAYLDDDVVEILKQSEQLCDIKGPRLFNHLIRTGYYALVDKQNFPDQEYKVRSQELGVMVDVTKTGDIFTYLDEQDFHDL